VTRSGDSAATANAPKRLLGDITVAIGSTRRLQAPPFLFVHFHTSFGLINCSGQGSCPFSLLTLLAH
jgi:hypothetical protein